MRGEAAGPAPGTAAENPHRSYRVRTCPAARGQNTVADALQFLVVKMVKGLPLFPKDCTVVKDQYCGPFLHNSVWAARLP